MQDFHLLTNIAVALLVAFVGGLLVRRLGLPTIVGYLIAGMMIGPFTPGFVGDTQTIGELAELGVIFLMFGVGLHFSLRDLWVVRDLALPGALLQTAIATLLGFFLAQSWGWSFSASLVLGLALSVASTVVLLRGLMDQGLLNSVHGQVAVGWLVVEDILTVIILVVMRAAENDSALPLWQTMGWTIGKALVFAVLMLVFGARFVPWLLRRTALTGSRELFILSIVAVAVGTAFIAAELFGVSLALGAFLAGVMVAESSISYQVGADVLPFQEVFTVLFFVSVGMLVNPAYLLANAIQVLAVTALIVIGKPLIAATIAFFFPYPARTALVVAAGLSQIGEFSFLLGTTALSLNLLERDQYSLILAGSVISIMLNPLMFRLVSPVESLLRRYPRLWHFLDRHGPARIQPTGELEGHVVVVGYGRVGHHIVDVLNRIGIPRLVIDSDAGRVAELDRQGVPTLYGDAANSQILEHASLEHARALVVTVAEEAAAEVIVATGRRIAPRVPIIARARTENGVGRLSSLGAGDVIHPELEGGLEIVRHTLLRLKLPPAEVERYAEAVRRDHYDVSISTPEEHHVLDQLLAAARGMQITWHALAAGTTLVGQSVSEAHIRERTGASVIAVIRDGHLYANPKSAFCFQVGDIIGVIGEEEQIQVVDHFFAELAPQPIPDAPAPPAVPNTESQPDAV